MQVRHDQIKAALSFLDTVLVEQALSISPVSDNKRLAALSRLVFNSHLWRGGLEVGRECWPHKLRVSSPVNQSTGSMDNMPLLPAWMEPIAHVVSTILLLR